MWAEMPLDLSGTPNYIKLSQDRVTSVVDCSCFVERLHLANYLYILILGVPEFGVSASRLHTGGLVFCFGAIKF